MLPSPVSRSNRLNLVALVCILFWTSDSVHTNWAVVTSDDYGTHVTTPGEDMFGINHDGVAQILMNGNFGCTGALLEGGMHVLTAGHCLNNANVVTITVRFTLESGQIDIEAHLWQPHPDFGSISGTDVGIITLSERAPPEIPRYSPLRALGSEIDNPNVLFGYGVTGYAGTGRDTRDGAKRGGRNLYEATGDTPSINSAIVGGSEDELWLFSDFDSGLEANDGFGLHFGKADLGFGDDEVYASSGDSGAPIFVSNPFGFVIAGVVSGGTRFNGSPNSDLDDTVNATWGQFSRDARISSPRNLSFIDSFTSSVLEPQPISNVTTSLGIQAQIKAVPGQLVYFRASSDLKLWQQLKTHQATQSPERIELISSEKVGELKNVFFVSLREPTTLPDLPPPPDPPEPDLSPLPNGRLFGSDAGTDELIAISPESGSSESLGDTAFASINGLAFDVNMGTLYGVDVATNSLVAINESTGQLNLVGSTGINFPNTVGLAYDPGNDVLYATSNGIAANLYTVNRLTGIASQVGPLGVNIPGLAFDPTTESLYGVSGQTNSLYIINTSTGETNLLGELGINTSFCGLAYDAASGELYLSDPSSDSLYSINRNDGSATLIGRLRLPQVNGLAAKNQINLSP